MRGHKVMLDADLAALYGVQTSALNQAVRRNQARFPADFRFQLSTAEWAGLKSQIVTSNQETDKYHKVVVTHAAAATGTRGGRRKLLWAFSEHGAIMAATVVNSKQAVAMSVYVVRAFIQMRERLAADAAVVKRLAEIDKTLLEHDQALRTIWTKLQPLLAPPAEPPRRRIGFHTDDE